MDWEALLADLEAALERLAGQGVTWVNVRPDDSLARLLPGDAGGAGGRGAPGEPVARGATGRVAGVLASLKGEPPPPAIAAPTPGSPGSGAPAGEPAQRPAALAAAASAPAGGPASRRGGDAAGLAALAAQYAACEACKLSKGRNTVVFGVGHPAPAIMFIGEGPGADEDAQGEPFVGQAGRLLTGLIAALGLTRGDVYITNIVKCRPPNNRNPEPDEAAACRPILEKQIELLNPGLIVTLGNVPLKALKPEARGITRERGVPFLYGSRRVLPTFHPSYLLRNPPAIGDCWADFRQAFALAYPDSGI